MHARGRLTGRITWVAAASTLAAPAFTTVSVAAPSASAAPLRPSHHIQNRI
jgi:hypothetical protein